MLKRSGMFPDRYEYLTKDDSDLYDTYLKRDDEQSKLIVTLLERIAHASEYSHRNDWH